MSDFTYQTPANQAPDDFKDLQVSDQKLNIFLADWNVYQDAWTKISAQGNPWSNKYDAPRSGYIDPVKDGWPDNPAVPVMWTPFPARLTKFFSSSESVNQPQLKQALTSEQLWELADTGRITVNGDTWTLYNPSADAKDILTIPAQNCPEADWQGKFRDFAPAGPRGWLDEYNEFCVTNENGPGSDILSVQFTSENPAYWMALWQQDPAMVTELYQQYIDPAVKEEDLYLLYPAESKLAGQPVIDPTTDRPAYDPTNKWNSGTQHVPGQGGGAMHLTSPPNTLSAEVYLAAASTILRESANGNDPQALLCCSQYGQNFRNSDPNIGATANNVAAAGNYLTLTDPVGLYMQTPDWSMFRTPDGTCASEFWNVTRGEVESGNGSDSILQVIFSVPDSKPYNVSNIEVLDSNTGDWNSIRWASQIQNTFKIALRVTPKAGYKGVLLPCLKSRINSQPGPVQLIPETLFLGNSPSDLPLGMVPSKASVRVALMVQGASAQMTTDNVRVQFTDPAIAVSIVNYYPDAGSIPGLTSGSGAQVIIADLTVGEGARSGLANLRVLNPDEDADVSAIDHPWAVGMLFVKAS